MKARYPTLISCSLPAHHRERNDYAKLDQDCFLKMFSVYSFLRERERVCMSRGGAERDMQNLGQAPGRRTWGSSLRTVRS